MTSSFSVEVGRLLCGNMRELLISEKFSGRNIEWIEGRGWVSRLFTIKGNCEDVEKIRERIEYWMKCMEKPCVINTPYDNRTK